jgi:UDP-N-acetylmuramoyl-tripeptide--D-alanyl-D-alanine ligase
MSALWTARDAAAATGAILAAGADWSADGVSIDTRAIARRDLFVALKGPRFDGHDFVAAALSSGAAAAMVDHVLPSVDPARLLAVADTQAGLEALAAAARARSGARVAAVTGSVGKTGTKEALAKVLGEQGPTHASVGNLNNHIGTPLSLARMPAATRFAVFELGMNHAGEISPLSSLVRPNAAIVTTVEAAHLEYFDGVEGIADAKAEIFDGMGPDGTAILNRDNPQFDRLARRARARGVGRIWSFGESGEEARLLSAALESDGSAVEARILGRRVDFRLSLPGRHQVQNALAVLLAVAALEADIDAAASALSRLSPVEGRGAVHAVDGPGGGFRLIDESYNASPAAVLAALSVLGMTPTGPGGRRILVLGDMLELGPNGPAEHAALADAVAAAGVALVFTAGPLSRHLHDALPAALRGAHAADAAALAPLVTAEIRSGDLALVKGSAGSRMATVVKALRDLGGPGREARHAV